jgi:hypothetical protein
MTCPLQILATEALSMAWITLASSVMPVPLQLAPRTNVIANIKRFELLEAYAAACLAREQNLMSVASTRSQATCTKT